MKKTIISFKDEDLVLKEKSGIYCIDCNKIVSISCDHPYLKITIINEKYKLIFFPLKEIIHLLPDCFVICNRSELINLHFFSSLKTKNHQCHLYLKTGDEVHVSGEYIKTIKEKIDRYLSL